MNNEIDIDEVVAALNQIPNGRTFSIQDAWLEAIAKSWCREIIAKGRLMETVQRFQPDQDPDPCNHYGMKIQAMAYIHRKDGQVVYCPACGRRVAHQDWREAFRAWNRLVSPRR